MLLGSLWPKANNALSGFVHNELMPRLREVLPGVFKGLHFSRFTLGQNVPEFGPIEVCRLSESHVQIELEMRYFSDVDFLLDAGAAGLTIGISHLTFVGRLCLALKPLVETWPVVGGLHVFFCNQPRVELKYQGIALLAEFPGFAEKVQGVVDDFFRDRMVLPNCRSYWYTRDERIVNLTQGIGHMPIGVLRVRVLRARNLAGANWQLGSAEKFTSDPYCKLCLGSSSSTTSTVSKTTSPQWPTNEPSAYFVVYHREQGLEINIMDEDKGVIRRNVVTSLGRLPPTSVRSILAEWPVALHAGKNGQIRRAQMTLDTSKVNRSMLHVNDPVINGIPSEIDLEVEWFDLSPHAALPSSGPSGRTPTAMVLVELHSGSGFPEVLAFDKKGYRWRCSLNQKEEPPVISKRGESREEEPPELTSTCTQGSTASSSVFSTAASRMPTLLT